MLGCLVVALPVLLAVTQARAFEPTAGENVEIRAYCTGFAQARDIVDYHAKHGAQEGYMIFRGYRNTFICYEKIVIFTPEREVYTRDVGGGALTIWRGLIPGTEDEIFAFFLVREIGS
jgi:hypothetical protein